MRGTSIILLLLVGIAPAVGCAESAPPAAAAYDLAGNPIDPVAETGAAVTVLIFVRDDCPISNRYAPTLQRLHTTYAPRGVAFYVVYPDPETTAEAIRAHLADYRHPGTPLHDPQHALVDRVGATITPEAAVFGADGRLVYHGRIDDWYVDFGRSRPVPIVHDLQNAIDAALEGRAVEQETAPAVGCFIVDLKPSE